MRIGVMLRHVKQQRGGFRTYTNNLLEHLVKLDTVNEYIFVYHDEDSAGSYSVYPNVEEIVVGSPSRLTWDQIAMISVVRRKQLDLIFNPKLSIPLFADCKKIFVLHGGDWFTFPQNYEVFDRFYHSIAVSIYCKKADSIISVSNSATQHIIRALRVDPGKIRTIQHGVSDHFKPTKDEEVLAWVRQKYHLPDSFILYVGQIYPMKNVGGIVRAFSSVHKRLPHKLVLVGNPGPKSKSDLALIDKLQLQDDVILTGWVPDEHLPAMYSLADLFVFPSLYEGFGIPLLEAMACGCPIVTSNVETPVEVVDNAAILVDPHDVNSIAEGIYEGLNNEGLRQDLIQKGFKRAKNFSWEESAKDTLALFESIAGGNVVWKSGTVALMAVDATISRDNLLRRMSINERGVSMVALGTERFTYEVAEGWGKLPDGWGFKEVAAVGVDARDNVYAFNRGEHPMIVFDKDGNFLRSWGEGIFPRAHGITMGPDDTILCTDDGDHTVRQCTLDGKVLFTLGTPGQPAPFMSGNPFNRCTHVAIDPRNGEFYVSDGYGNARVHKYSPDGRLLFSWGQSGTGPGEFNIVHNICTDKDGWVYVADRENHRIQVFDPNGKFETQWVDMARPCGLYIDQSSELVYVGELGVAIGANHQATGLGPRVSIYNTKGDLLARLGDQPEGEAPGQFIAPHGVCIDSRGDIYVGEVSWTHTGSHLNPPRGLRSLQKLVRKG